MKKFLIIGNMNAITYKEIFPLIKENKMWLGFGFNKTMEFVMPDSYEKFNRIDEHGNKIGKVPAITWYTNLVHDKRLEGIYCPQKYAGREDKYPVYDNYDAIEIGHYTKKGKWEGSLDELPYDYDGVMGVPITFLGQYSPEQFEIIGFFNNYNPENVENIDGAIYGEAVSVTSTTSLFRGPVVNGKALYFRVLIRRKK